QDAAGHPRAARRSSRILCRCGEAGGKRHLRADVQRYMAPWVAVFGTDEKLRGLWNRVLDERKGATASPQSGNRHAGERLTFALQQPAKADLVAVASLRQQIQDLDARYDRVPSTALLADAGQCLSQVRFLLMHVAPTASAENSLLLRPRALRSWVNSSGMPRSDGTTPRPPPTSIRQLKHPGVSATPRPRAWRFSARPMWRCMVSEIHEAGLSPRQANSVIHWTA